MSVLCDDLSDWSTWQVAPDVSGLHLTLDEAPYAGKRPITEKVGARKPELNLREK